MSIKSHGGFFYFNAIRKQIIQFIDLFSNIKIARTDKAGKLIKYIEVPIKYSPKSKTWTWLKEHLQKNKEDLIFPFIGIELTTVSYSQNRAVSDAEKIYIERNDAEYQLKYIYNPVPYDFGFRMTITCEYMSDIDQILEQILPYFTPFINIKLTIPEIGILDENSLDVRVLLQGVTPESLSEIPMQDYRYINYVLDFSMHGYTFLPLIETPTVKTIHNNFRYGEPTQEKLDNLLISQPDYKTVTTGYDISTPLSAGMYIDEDAKLIWKYELFDYTTE